MRKPQYNQGDIIGYRDILYVITEIEGGFYVGIIAGDSTSNKQYNRIIDIDDNPQIRLVVRGQ
jgi:hypothetical protein